MASEVHSSTPSMADELREAAELAADADEGESYASLSVTRNVIAALAPMMLAIAGIIGAVSFGIGTPAAPGSGFWPLIVSAAIAVLSLILLLRGRHLEDTEPYSKASLSPLIGAASLLVYVWLLPLIGVEILTLLLVLLWLIGIGRERVLKSVIIAVTTVAIVYVVFIMLLRVPLPHIL